MTQPDVLSLKSFITLPEPAIKFSTVNLPGSSLIDKANLNLHFLNYWQFLKEKTKVNFIVIDNLTDEIDFNENNFAENIKSYFFNLGEDEINGLSREEIYKKFISLIIPKTKVLFNLMKKYITGRLSIVDVVSYLEPFLVYTDDLTYMQYIEITNFINDKISEFNKKFIEKTRLFAILNKSLKSSAVIFENAYSIINILSTENGLRNSVITEGYDINNDNDLFTNSEILRKITIRDYKLLYTNALSLQNAPLMFPSEFADIFEKEKIKKEGKLHMEEEKDQCKSMILTKYYKSLESLEADNDKPIYFDKKYDKTNYGVLNNYEKEIIKTIVEIWSHADKLKIQWI
jgi:hypothetical protein